MCPITGTSMVFASIAASVLAAGVGAYGMVKQSEAQNKQAEYQGKVAQVNADTAADQAADARERGQIQADLHREKVGRLVGKQRSIYGASGVSLSSGTPLDTVVDTAEMGEFDAQNILANAEREAYGYQTQADNYLMKGNLERSKKSSPWVGVASTALSAGGQVANKWYSLT
jgi:hypothetical protein